MTNMLSRALLFRTALLVGAVLVTILGVGGIWSVRNSSALVWEQHYHAASMTGKELANFASAALVNRDYARLETSLMQAAITQGVRRAVITDPGGAALGHVVRSSSQASPTVVFDSVRFEPPGSIRDVVKISEARDFVSVWSPVDAEGMLGWVYLELDNARTDNLISTLRRNTLFLAQAAALAGLLAIAAVFYQFFCQLRLQEELVNQHRQRLEDEKAHQAALIVKLEEAQNQLLQSEKMAAIGQLAAGVAHEINNPVGFVNSNLGTLRKYISSLLVMLDEYKAHENEFQQPSLELLNKRYEELDVEYLKGDIDGLLLESLDGVGRVRKIVSDLKDFSRADATQWELVNLEKSLDSTLNVVWNEIKYKANVVKEYAGIPDVECIGGQVNQVFMNLLVNAAQAISWQGVITIRTGQDDPESVWVEVQDTGEGISPEYLNKIFEPFFTTKPVGKGTGLGLSLSYGIIQKHGGKIDVHSEVGKGSTFRISLPIHKR